MRSFYVLEDSQTTKIQESIKRTINYQIDYLDGIANTLSVSNIFFNSCLINKENGPQEIDKDIIKRIDANYLVLVSLSGDIVYNQGAVNNKTVSIPEDSIIKLINTSKATTKLSGLIEFPDYGMATISVKPIKFNDEVSGYLIIGKILDKKLPNSFGADDSFSIEKINKSISPDINYADFLKRDFFDKRDTNKLYAYSAYKDIYGNKIFYSKIGIPRDIYRVGTSQMEIITYCVFLVQLLMMIAFCIIVERVITKRLKLLTSSVELTNKKGNKNKIIVFEGDDEIAILSSESSKAFEKIQKAKYEAEVKQRQLDSIFNSIHDSIYIFDKNNVLISSYIYNEKKKMKDKTSIVLPKDIIDKVIEAAEKIKKDKKLKNIEYSIMIGKEKHWFNANISQRIDNNGNHDGVIVVAREITEGKKMEDGLKDKLSELERLNRLMVGRELKMIELKEKIKELESKK
jgi:PAS domain-containing protein